MNKFKSIFGVALCGVILGTAYTVVAQGNRDGYATVIRVQGAVSYTLGDNNWYPLVPGKYLPAGASIRTGDNGVVDVVLGHAVDAQQGAWVPGHVSQAPDSAVRGMTDYKPTIEQNIIRLTPESELAITKLTTTDTGADTVSDTELDLKKGKIYASVKKLSGASQYLVKIPNGIAGVRGTEFSLSADGATAVFRTHGHEGLVLSVTLPGGTTTTVVIADGQAYVPGSSQPVQLTPAVLQVLKDVFAAIPTCFVQVEVAAVIRNNQNSEYVSPTTGAKRSAVAAPSTP